MNDNKLSDTPPMPPHPGIQPGEDEPVDDAHMIVEDPPTKEEKDSSAAVAMMTGAAEADDPAPSDDRRFELPLPHGTHTDTSEPETDIVDVEAVLAAEKPNVDDPKPQQTQPEFVDVPEPVERDSGKHPIIDAGVSATDTTFHAASDAKTDSEPQPDSATPNTDSDDDATQTTTDATDGATNIVSDNNPDEPLSSYVFPRPKPQPAQQVYAVRGRVITTSRMIVDGVVIVAGDAIAWIGESTAAAAAGFGQEVIEAQAPTDDRYILPGLIDIHNHGGGGKLFPGAQTYNDVMTAVMDHRRAGTTSLVASLVSASPLVLRERAELLADAADAGELAGIHFEGPFLGNKHHGIHDPVHIQSPNPALARELMVVSRGHCVSMTVAPEKPYTMGPAGVVETLIDGKAVPSFGHTDATGPQMRKTLREVREKLLSASTPRSPQATITHMYNAMQPPHHRDPGPVFEILADAAGGGVICEIIGDGVHVSPDFVRTTYELIGREQIALITDSVAAGAPDGDYVLGSVPLKVTNGVPTTAADGAIGGGACHLIDVVRTTHEGGLPLIDAVYCASAVPARILGDSTVGSIEVGKQADLLVTDAKLNPIQVIRRGKPVE